MESQVISRCHQLQMIGIDAQAILAAVVNVHAFGNLTDLFPIDGAMNVGTFVNGIPICFRHTLPNPARRLKAAIFNHVHRAGILDRVMPMNVRNMLTSDVPARTMRLFRDRGLLTTPAKTVAVRIRDWRLRAKALRSAFPRAVRIVLHGRIEHRAADRALDLLFPFPVLASAFLCRTRLATHGLAVLADLRAAIAAVSWRDSPSQRGSTRHAAGLSASIPDTRPFKVKHLAADLTRQFNDGWGRIFAHRLLQSIGATPGDVPPSPRPLRALIIPLCAVRSGGS